MDDKTTEARLALHYASQLLAAVGATQLPPREDFSHTALSWHDGALWTDETPAGYQVGLRFSKLTLEVRGRGTFACVPLAGLELDTALARLTDAIELDYGVLDRPLARPTHELPDHPIGAGAPFPAVDEAALSGWSSWFEHAARHLVSVRSTEAQAGPVYTWPHHFDMATLIALDPAETGESARSIGVGFSPGDGGYPDGYWYVTPWPYPTDLENLPPLPVGVWHVTGWVGAVLTTDDLSEMPDRTAALFLDAAIPAARGLLSRSP